jgi:hypothetical protein
MTRLTAAFSFTPSTFVDYRTIQVLSAQDEYRFVRNGHARPQRYL